jgi:acetylornithine aminotransferase
MSHQLMNTYAPMDVAFTKGEGAWLWDEHGKRYLDAISGLGVCALGHAHPELARVIAEQAATLMHTGNLVRIPWQETLAGKLCDISGMDRVFFGNSGAEAIECALKITRLVGHQRGYETPIVAVMEKSFHGRTMAALAATGSRKVQAGFEPLVSGFVRAPFNDVEALRKVGQHASEVTAVLVEPIQGESGVRTPDPGYLTALRSLCDEQGWLLIFDEIQSGLCRSGRWYAHQHEDIRPDILTTAKALANGLPVGACVARGEAAAAMKPGQHGSTFGGNPLVSRAACTVLDIMERDGLAEQAAQTGRFIKQAFRERLSKIQSVREIRGRGLMIGIELDRPAGAVKEQAMESGVIINVTQENVIRLLPPLIIDRAQAEEIVAVVSDSIEALE